MDNYLQEYLKKHKIKYCLYKHKPVFTVSQSRDMPEIQKIPGLRTKNLFIKSNSGSFYLVCLPYYKRLNTKFLKLKLGVKKIRFGTAEELKCELNLVPGSVSILGMIYAKNTNLIIDKQVYESKQIGVHPNINTETLVINHNSLLKFLNSIRFKTEVIDFE